MSEPPILNEGIILQCLHPSHASDPNEIRTTLKYLVLDCYDRKILREPFDEILTKSMELHWTLTRMEDTALAKAVLMKAGVDTPTFTEKLTALQKEVTAMRLNLCGKFGLVMECESNKLQIN